MCWDIELKELWTANASRYFLNGADWLELLKERSLMVMELRGMWLRQYCTMDLLCERSPCLVGGGGVVLRILSTKWELY